MGLQTTIYTEEGWVVDKIEGLTGKRYCFYWCESPGIVLDSYYELSRPSTRHKFRIDATWDRLNSRDIRIPKPGADEGVMAVALRQIQHQVAFKGGW